MLFFRANNPEREEREREREEREREERREMLTHMGLQPMYSIKISILQRLNIRLAFYGAETGDC